MRCSFHRGAKAHRHLRIKDIEFDMKHENYSARIDHDDEDGIFTGRKAGASWPVVKDRGAGGGHQCHCALVGAVVARDHRRSPAGCLSANGDAEIDYPDVAPAHRLRCARSFSPLPVVDAFALRATPCGERSSETSWAPWSNGIGSRRSGSSSSEPVATTPAERCAAPRSRRPCWTAPPLRPPCIRGADAIRGEATVECSRSGSDTRSRSPTEATETVPPCASRRLHT